jgi:aspartyl/asparaginyl beta-hydroxylase (cupin superfamily)
MIHGDDPVQPPQDSSTLNEAAQRFLLSGDSLNAHAVLKRALQAEPANPSLWINLAAALRGLGRADEEMEALEKVLALDPKNLRALLQKASLQEIIGQPRAASKTFRHVLQMIPPGQEPPQALRPVLQHARDVVTANDRGLEAFLETRLTAARQRHGADDLRRFDRCLELLLRKRPIFQQKPSEMYFPGLPAIEFYERRDFPWLDALEAASNDIREELIDLLAAGDSTLQPSVQIVDGRPLNQWRELNHSRRWGVYFLWRNGVAFPDHLARFPRTVAALQGWPRGDIPGCGPSAVFSILDAKTRIPPHSGVSNARLIVHLPLIVPEGCWFRVGAERREWHPGKALVFDDTIEHEAWNGSDTPRAVLILDIWSPFLSEAERELVRVAADGVMQWYGTSSYHEA